jgi:hypothetical protein
LYISYVCIESILISFSKAKEATKAKQVKKEKDTKTKAAAVKPAAKIATTIKKSAPRVGGKR